MKTTLKQFLLQKQILPKNKIEAAMLLGELWVNDKKAYSLGQKIDTKGTDKVFHKPNLPKYVGRGAYKLEHALEYFQIEVKNKICVDFGACTGGFTDVLLQKGAKKIFAIEKGLKQLDYKILTNPKVINLEGVSLFDLSSQIFEEKIDLVVCDLSFTPLKRSLPKIFELTAKAPLIALLKPHYEAQDLSILRNGVIKDEIGRQKILENFKEYLAKSGFVLTGITTSPIKGGVGNIEYLVHIV